MRSLFAESPDKIAYRCDIAPFLQLPRESFSLTLGFTYSCADESYGDDPLKLSGFFRMFLHSKLSGVRVMSAQC